MTGVNWRDLQGLAENGYIHPDDMELHEAAGTPEEDFMRGAGPRPDKDPFDPREFGASRRQACWPGCHENEAHAKKFHKDKEARYRMADSPGNWLGDIGSAITNAPKNLGQMAGEVGNTIGDAVKNAPKNLGEAGGTIGDAVKNAPANITRDVQASVQLVDPRTGNIHNLIDPGELDEGDDPGHPTFRKQPRDWARRGEGAKWQRAPSDDHG